MRWVLWSTLVGIILTVSQAGANDALTARMLQEMKRRDERIVHMGLSLNGKIRAWSPLGDRKSIAGLARRYHFRFTCNRLATVYEQSVEFFEEIPRRTEPTDPEAADRGFVYNKEGVQFFVFTASERAFHQRGFLNAVLATNRSLYVAPDGKFGLGKAEGYDLGLYPLDDLGRTMTRALQVLLCSGRGYTFVIAPSNATCRERADGLVEIRAEGRASPELPLPTGFFANAPGTERNAVWLLVVDPKADHLVREATLLFSGSEEPFIRIKTSGQLPIRGDATIAKHGEYRLKPVVPYEEVTVEFTQGEWRFSQAFYEEVRRALLNPPDETIIRDYRFSEPPLTFTYRKSAESKTPDTNRSINR
ncbi:hypothetical protein HRbin15_02054 [bacterium HR15]|nr:hypothetical protein HRbin15_02054 [bacterium HR15]